MPKDRMDPYIVDPKKPKELGKGPTKKKVRPEDSDEEEKPKKKPKNKKKPKRRRPKTGDFEGEPSSDEEDPK